MPLGGPLIGWPRKHKLPALGSASPAIRRNSVDLPEPERPSRPTIWPSSRRKCTPSSTARSPPSGFGKALQTPSTWSRAVTEWLMTEFIGAGSLGQAKLTFGVIGQRSPEYAVCRDHEQAHRRDAQNDAMEISGRGRLGDIGPQAVRLHLDVMPAHDFGDDR